MSVYSCYLYLDNPAIFCNYIYHSIWGFFSFEVGTIKFPSSKGADYKFNFASLQK